MQIINVLNLGAGVQSSTLLLMMLRGDLPRPDHIIFADTQWEPAEVYEHLEWLEEQAQREGLRITRVTAGNIKADALESQVRGKAEGGKRCASMPYYVDTGSDTEGKIRRQCTAEYKIAPIDKYVKRQILGLKPMQRIPKDLTIHRWMGISSDEMTRVKASRHKRYRHIYPLAGYSVGATVADTEDFLPLGRRWSRRMCLDWAEANYPDRRFPRSACIGCPFHSNAEWRHLKVNDPASFADAVEFDKQIRKCGGMRGDVYLHASLKPLDEVNLDSDVDKGQTVFGWVDECEGMCGI